MNSLPIFIISLAFILVFLFWVTLSYAEPEWYANGTSVASNTEYLPGRNYGFQINWTENVGSAWENITNVTFEFNGINYTQFTSTAVQNNTALYWINLTDLAANTTGYIYRWYANNTTAVWNSSDSWLYKIAKNISNPVRLYLNGSQANAALEHGLVSNATAEVATANAGTALLWRDEVAKTNPDLASLYIGTYSYKSNTSGTANYSANNTGVTYSLTVASNGSIAVNVKFETTALPDVRVFLLKYGINASRLTNINGDAVFSSSSYNMTAGTYVVALDENTIEGYKKPDARQVVWSVGDFAKVNFQLEKEEKAVAEPAEEECKLFCMIQKFFSSIPDSFWNFINWFRGLFGGK